MLPENPRERLGMVIAGLVLLGVGVIAWAAGKTPDPKDDIVHVRSTAESELATSSDGMPSDKPPTAIAVQAAADQPAAAPQSIVVHVGGPVRRPGVYSLPAGSRLQRAIHAAGGFADDADRDALNLAARLEDSDQILVPVRMAQSQTVPKATGQARQTRPTASRGRQIGAVAHSKPQGESSARKFKSPGDGTVSLNRADLAALQQLPGIGAATAQRILDARKERGKFTAIEDLGEVKGIGEKRLERLRPFLTLD